jgi:hypothetical protein
LVPFIKPIDFEAIDCFWMYDFPSWGCAGIPGAWLQIEENNSYKQENTFMFFFLNLP